MSTTYATIPETPEEAARVLAEYDKPGLPSHFPDLIGYHYSTTAMARRYVKQLGGNLAANDGDETEALCQAGEALRSAFEQLVVEMHATEAVEAAHRILGTDPRGDPKTPEETEEIGMSSVDPAALARADLSLRVGGFGDDTAAARLAIRQLVSEDLDVDDPTIDGLYEAAKQLQQEADMLVQGLADHKEESC